MSRSEKLAALLTVIFAAVGWLIQHIADEVGDEHILAYAREVRWQRGASVTTTTLTLENVSRVANPGVVDVYASYLPVAGKVCESKLLDADNGRDYEHFFQSVSIEPLGVTSRMQDDPQPTWGDDTLHLSFSHMTPGSSYRIYIRHPNECEIQFGVHTEDKHTRLTEYGLETFLVQRRLGIMLSLVVGLLLIVVVIYQSHDGIDGQGKEQEKKGEVQ